MPQELNFNTSPYFDDFDVDKNFYRVLFKPGYPVQARELTTLQSILQNQIEQFGNHIFKEGSVVIPGQSTYIREFNAVEIQDTFSGIPISFYLNDLVGQKITGQDSGVTAKIVKVLSSVESDRGNNTLYVEYLETSSNFSQKEFFDNETLTLNGSVTYGNSVIREGEGFALTINEGSTSVGSAYAVSAGVYFLRGTFVNVSDQLLILDQYTNIPSYRIGFDIDEQIITSDSDETLTDNAQGFNNFAAPGSDRFKILPTLSKKVVTDLDNTNFIEIAEIRNGVVRETNSNTQYNFLSDELARRTYDESGDYYVKPFSVFCKESLNDGINNGGIFNEGELTYSGNVPDDDSLVYKITPGKAYVKGYEVDIVGTNLLDAPKPRTTKLTEDYPINFGFTPTLEVNNVSGSPKIGLNTSTTLSLRDERVGASYNVASGSEIGVARIYDYVLEQGGYTVTDLTQNIWDLSLFDIQTYSTITLNEPVTLSVPTRITGQYTGATAFLKTAASNSSTLTVYEINGTFSEKEPVVFDDADEDQNSRFITAIRNYGISDVKSVFTEDSGVGSGITFSADTVQRPFAVLGNAQITAEVAGTSTVTVEGTDIQSLVFVNNILQYTQPGISSVSLAKVDSVSYEDNTIVISPVENVGSFIKGELPTSLIEVNNLTVVSTNFQTETFSGNYAYDKSLYSTIPNKNVKSVNLDNSELVIRKQLPVVIGSDGFTNTLTLGENEAFLDFDEERYTLIRSDGTLEVLTRDKFAFNSGNTELVIGNLGSSDSNAILISTVKKSNIKSKTKIKKIVDSIVVDKSTLKQSGIGATTLNDGLVFGNYPYGTRVQDKEICLNYPEVLQIYGIYESNGVGGAQSPSANLSSLDGQTSTTNDLIIGEEFVGALSGAKAIYAEKIDDNTIRFIYTNKARFTNDELVTFSESSVTGNIGTLTASSKNIIGNYTLRSGQKDTYYDYSRIVRNSSSSAPTNQLKIYFMRSFYNASDDGDITTTNSYNNFNYTNEIGTISGNRNTDIVDYRPRVSDYTVAVDTPSPFEFEGRSFDQGNHSAKEIISTDDSVTITYDYYLPRIDRVYLSKDKVFSIKFGSPSDNPNLPEDVSGSMNIANIYLPAYVYDTSDIKVEFIDYKRYQMKDLFKLENRIKDLEYYTSLSLIESKTENLFIDDGTGLNRFKSGFFVDNFTTLSSQDSSAGVKNSIDDEHGELRPSHYTTNLKLEISNNTIPGVGESSNSNDDKSTAVIAGSNVRRTGDILSLNYTSISWVNQPSATKSEYVNPFYNSLWEGNIKLDPSIDIWVDTNKFELNNINSSFEQSFYSIVSSISEEIVDTADGKRLGIIPNIWGSWKNVGVSRSKVSNLPIPRSQSNRSGGVNVARPGIPNTFKTVKDVDSKQVSTLLKKQRQLTNSTGEQSSGDRVVNKSITNYVRSRNITFTAQRLKPYQEVYPFFDGTKVVDYCFSKLVELEESNRSGTFTVGEIVVGEFTTENSEDPSRISFRIAQPNHKFGPYNNPTDVFTKNPYNKDSVSLEDESYSTTSSLLNIDMTSLSDDLTSQFSGILKSGMKLRGLTSGAEAVVSDVRLIADCHGTLIGSFNIPNPESDGAPKFETGRGRFRLTSDENNAQNANTTAEETYYSQDQKVNLEEGTSSLRNSGDVVDNGFKDQRLNLDSNINERFSSRLNGGYRDPLAQTFVIDDPSGIYLTGVNLFFRSKDTSDLPVSIELREVNLGTPTQKIVPFSQVELIPSDVAVSTEADTETPFTFESPVYLESQKEYALVVSTNSSDYEIWTSTLGQSDIGATETGQTKSLVTTQKIIRSLFKSQNASVWAPSPYESLKFELFRAEFNTSPGITQFFNSNLYDELKVMSEDPLTMESRKSRISLASTVTSVDELIGKTVQQTVGVQTATGKIVGLAKSAFGELNIVDAGIGYTGSNITFTNVSLQSITGSGINATADITINNGGVVASGATIVNGGSGYVKGDILEPVSIGSQNLGSGMKLSVSEVSSTNKLVIDNIQGSFTVGGGNSITYLNNSGITSEFTVGVAVTISAVDVITDGTHINVYHRNHGMHSTTNIVKLENVSSDLEQSQLVSNYPGNAADEISLATGTGVNFESFEGRPVSGLNPGYVKISDEILSYTGVSGDTLTAVTRGIDGTTQFNYLTNTFVEKYELNGISLRRINKTHNLSDVTVSNPIGIDNYYVKIDMSANGVDRSSDLKINSTKSTGGIFAKASYNIPYELMIPNISQLVPNGTNISYEAQTISGTSIGSNEASFVNKGISKITNNAENYFETQRLIASSNNESQYLDDLPANKSLNVIAYLENGGNSKISPIIDLSNNSVILSSNRINNPVTNYSEDPRINSINDDPNLFTYATKNIELNYSATSIKVILDAYIHNTSDVRLLYSINDNETFVPFPGYNNFNVNGSTKDERDSNGTSDTRTAKQDVFYGDPTDAEFLEYTFSVNDLPAFKSFRIKLIGTSTNQAIVPVIKDLRAVALA